MHDFFQARFGNWADPEIYELARINHYDRANEMGYALDADPEVWNEADWEDFSRDLAEFERYHDQRKEAA